MGQKLSLITKVDNADGQGIHRNYILMRKAVACELGVSVVEVVWAVDLNRAFRMVWGSTSGVGWEEAR